MINLAILLLSIQSILCYLMFQNIMKLKKAIVEFDIRNSHQINSIRKSFDLLATREDLNQITNRVDERIEHLGSLNRKNYEDKWDDLRKAFSRRKEK